MYFLVGMVRVRLLEHHICRNHIVGKHLAAIRAKPFVLHVQGLLARHGEPVFHSRTCPIYIRMVSFGRTRFNKVIIALDQPAVLQHSPAGRVGRSQCSRSVRFFRTEHIRACASRLFYGICHRFVDTWGAGIRIHRKLRTAQPNGCGIRPVCFSQCHIRCYACVAEGGRCCCRRILHRVGQVICGLFLHNEGMLDQVPAGIFIRKVRARRCALHKVVFAINQLIRLRCTPILHKVRPAVYCTQGNQHRRVARVAALVRQLILPRGSVLHQEGHRRSRDRLRVINGKFGAVHFGCVCMRVNLVQQQRRGYVAEPVCGLARLIGQRHRAAVRHVKVMLLRVSIPILCVRHIPHRYCC